MYYINLNLLVWKNFINMINRKEISSLENIKTNPKELRNLLSSIGANEILLSKPAHREELEKYIISVIDKLIEAILHEEGFEIGQTYDGMAFHYETPHFQEDSSISFEMQEDEDNYDLEEIYKIKIKHNIGTKTRIIKGEKNSIEELSESENMSFPVAITRQNIRKNLDDRGFVVSKTIKTGTKEGKDISLKEETNKRAGVRNIIIGNDSDSIQKEIDINGTSKKRNEKKVNWNGDLVDINSANSDSKEFVNNVHKYITKYPETRAYYDEIVGKDIVNTILKLKSEPRR